MKKPVYCAISSPVRSTTSFIVCTIAPYTGDFHIVGDIRNFKSFDEANQVAKDTAAGKYGHPKGQFVNLR